VAARLPRTLHPGAWWLWALGLATAASRTTNPLLLGLIVGVACLVVAARRPDAVWALGFRFYLYLGLVIVVMRVVFRVLFGGGLGPHVLLHLPEVPLPHWAAGITLLGPVSAESVLSGLYDGLRLATMLVCLGAANSLANPKRLLKSVPSALYELGTAVVVALSVAPQLIESVLRVRRARRLRAGPQKGTGALHGVVIPVLEDALDRSRALAAAMDSRGYGSTQGQPRRTRRVTGGLVLAGVVGICVGVYGLLDASTPRYLGAPVLGAGLLAAAAGLRVSGRRTRRTRYRPDPWRGAEWVIAGSGIAACAIGFLAGSVDAINLVPSLYPLRWPALPVWSSLGVLIAVLPAFLAPRPPTDRTEANPGRAASAGDDPIDLRENETPLVSTGPE
jgi:energy-coupling factor transport system permease protein